MNFDFSDEQKQLRDEARKFLAEKCPPKAVRTVLDGKQPYDRELWKGLADMGFLGVAIPEAFGGAGAGHLELCVIAEEIGDSYGSMVISGIEEYLRRHNFFFLTVIHRHGRIVPGEDIVLVLTASSHRHEAFAAAEFLMDYLKTQAPFWKRVERSAGANWVEAKSSDDSAAERWTNPASKRAAAE